MSEYSGFILVNRNTYLLQDVGKLRFRIAQDLLHKQYYILIKMFLTLNTETVYYIRYGRNISVISISYNVRAFLEEYEDIKGVIRIRKSKKNRQHIGQKKN
jgi:hypothetical protein